MQLQKIIQGIRQNWWQLLLITIGLGLMGVGIAQAKQDTVGDTIVIIHPSPSPSPEVTLLIVDVAGAVEKPGVYRLQPGSRVGDALIAAGGLSKAADRTYVAQQINQAAVVADGMKLYVPDINNKSTPLRQGSAGQVNSIVISVNTATESELDSLWGIGAARAKTIVENRPYTSWDELKQKAKITQDILDKNQGKIGL